MPSSCENRKKPSDSKKDEEFLDYCGTVCFSRRNLRGGGNVLDPPNSLF